MAVEPQEYEDDPIIAALGLTQEIPTIPPMDKVFGYFQKMDREVPPKFRLFLKTFECYMEGPMSRVAHKGPASCNGSELWLRTNGNYPDDITIVCTVEPGEAMQPVQPTHMAFYASYAYPKTTPWHEW
jgi:hypothetical protein